MVFYVSYPQMALGVPLSIINIIDIKALYIFIVSWIEQICWFALSGALHLFSWETEDSDGSLWVLQVIADEAEEKAELCRR